jgi:hypothetical protein
MPDLRRWYEAAKIHLFVLELDGIHDGVRNRRPAIPGLDLPNVFALRSVSDAGTYLPGFLQVASIGGGDAREGSFKMKGSAFRLNAAGARSLTYQIAADTDFRGGVQRASSNLGANVSTLRRSSQHSLLD